MNIKMAWRNIWRNPRRTLLTISAIAFACMLLVFMLSFQFGSYDAMINASVKIHTGHLQVQAKGYKEKQQMQQIVSDPASVEDILALLQAAQPEVVYTHNLADKHDTHVGVTIKTIEAIRALPAAERPTHLFGCEVWRDLDWMVGVGRKARVENLGLGGPLEGKPLNERSSLQDVLAVAIKREESSGAFYAQMAALSDPGPAKDLFEMLAKEETKHKRYVESIYEEDVYKEF